MRLAMITLHRETNYGSALQAFALKEVLSATEHEIEVIDYTSPTHSGLRGILRLYRGETGRPHHRLRGVMRRIVESRRAWGRGFESFFLSYLAGNGSRYRSLAQLRRNPPMADVYISGSDQLWNSDYYDGTERAFYLDFGPADIRRVSYATSFGISELRDDERDLTRMLLKKYDALGIREPTGRAIVERLGFDATVVLDPTLLLSAQRWRDLAHTEVHGQRYVLVYSVEEDRHIAVSRAAREIADRMNCEVWQVRAGGAGRAVPNVDRIWSYASPEVFLGLMSQALFVVTSSFHGTAFAVTFEREFLSIAPPMYADRAETLLTSIGLGDRFVLPSDTVGELAPIDWSRSRAFLARLQSDSREYLRCALKST